MPFEVAAILLARLGQTCFGIFQSLAGLLGGQHRLGGADADFHLARHSGDKPIKYVPSLIVRALFGVHLGATQFIVIAASAFVVLAIILFTFVETIERRVPIALA